MIDSLIETIPVMKNWESYIELLYEGFDSGDESSDDHRELVLIDLMVLCIKQVATGRSPRVKNTNRQDGFNLLLKKSDVNCIILIFL